MTDAKTEAMRDRRKKIAAEIEQLLAEDKDLEIAIRVNERYEGKTAAATSIATPTPTPTTTNGAGSLSNLGPPRPEGVPTLFEMTQAVLQEAIAKGRPGLKGSQIVEKIGEKFWPGVQGPQILPPIYSFAKQGRLKKRDDGIFQLVQK